VQSAVAHVRSRTPGNRSNLARSTDASIQSRAKSASTIFRPFTAPLQTFSQEYTSHEETESDDEILPISDSCVASAKCSNDPRPISAVSSSIHSQHSHDLSLDNPDITTSSIPRAGPRITWPIKIKVFALQDEDETRQQLLTWRADQRKTKSRRLSKQFFDLQLENKYKESIRRRKEIETFITPELIEEHQFNDPIFAKRYRQLKLAVRGGKIPKYDPNDQEIHITMNKSKIERTRTALITAKQTKIKNFYQNQQKINDENLSKRIDTFLKHLASLKQEQEEEI